jgi:hypothetical protein
MKPKNFPSRKLIRQAKAQGTILTEAMIAAARAVRSKKAGKGIPGGGRKIIKGKE